MFAFDQIFIKMEVSEVEEVSCIDLTEEDMREFINMEPYQVSNVLSLPSTSSPHQTNSRNRNIPNLTGYEDTENHDELIVKYIDGEINFPDIYAQLVTDDEADDDEDEVMASKEARQAKKVKAQSTRKAQERMEEEDDDVNVDGKITPSSSCTSLLSVSPNSHSGSQTCWLTEPAENSLQSRKRRKKKSTKKPLDGTMMGLMGEANLMFARGNYEMAEKLCMEVIRQNPHMADPFFTLAEIYEMQDPEKSLKFLTLAIHLDPSDCEQWKRLTQIHVQRGDLKKARFLYARAIRAHPRDYELRQQKAHLLEIMGERPLAMMTLLKTLSLIPFERRKLCREILQMVVNYFNCIGKSNIVLEAWEGAYTCYGRKFAIDDFIEMIKLLLEKERHVHVLNYLINHECILVKLKDGGDQVAKGNIYYYEIKPDTRIELRTYAFISMIALKNFCLVGRIIRDMHLHVTFVREHFIYYQYISEVLSKEELHACTINLLKPIINEHFVECPTTLLLIYGQSLYKEEHLKEAIDVYWKIIDIAPLCYDARFTLASLLKQVGRELEAAKVLKPPEDNSRPTHTRLLYERCCMLLEINQVNEALEIGCTLLGRNSIKLKTRQELLTASNGGSAYNAEGIKMILEMRNMIGVEEVEATTSKNSQPQSTNYLYSNSSQMNSKDNLLLEDEYKLFRLLYSAASKAKKYSVLERLCFAMVTTKRFSGYNHDLERIMVLSCYFNGDHAVAFNYLRELIHKDVNNMGLWNLLSLLVQKGHDLRYHRYVVRLVTRREINERIKIFTAHYHLHSNSFKYALNIYAPLLKQYKLPIAALCIAVVFNQIALQKKILRKCAAVSQSLAFIHKYSMLRSGQNIFHPDQWGEWEEDDSYSAASQEIFYNIGRIYHQVGIPHLAIFYYEKALRCQHPLIAEHINLLGLHQEIAFNLHLIYKANGNLIKARKYLYDYCVV